MNILKMLGLEKKRPDLPPPAKMETYIPQRATDIENLLYNFGQSRLDPNYQALTPGQQSMMFERIRQQLEPTFNQQIEQQKANIYQQGIEGSPGTMLLNRLRQDYLNDLSGRATDIAIQNVGLTESGRQSGLSILDQIRQGLMGQAAANQGIQQNYQNQVLQSYENADAQNSQTALALGQMLGQIPSLLMPTYGFSPAGMDKWGVTKSTGLKDLFSGIGSIWGKK